MWMTKNHRNFPSFKMQLNLFCKQGASFPFYRAFQLKYLLLIWYCFSQLDFWTNDRTRHPATSGIFCAFQHCRRCPLEGWKRFFHILFFFQFWILSDFVNKNLKNKVERHFQEKIPFQTHSRKFLPHVAILKNFKVCFRKNPSIFHKKTSNFIRFEISHYSSRLLQQICSSLGENNITFRREQKCRCWRERNWQTSFKKTSEMDRLRKRFFFHILNMAQNNKSWWGNDIKIFSSKREEAVMELQDKQLILFSNVYIWNVNNV